MVDFEEIFMKIEEDLKSGDFDSVTNRLCSLRSVISVPSAAREVVARYLNILFDKLCASYAVIDYCMNTCLARLVDFCFSLIADNHLLEI